MAVDTILIHLDNNVEFDTRFILKMIQVSFSTNSEMEKTSQFNEPLKKALIPQKTVPIHFELEHVDLLFNALR